MFQSIDPVELASALQQGPVTLIDVREVGEYAAGHVPGAVSIPMSVLPVRLSEVPRDAPVTLICHSGGRSAQVASWLARQGYTPVNVTGGTAAWHAAGHPLVAGMSVA